MSTTLKRTLAVAAAAGIAALLVWAFLEGRAEITRERERERPIKVPPRVSRGAGGEPIVTLDRETQRRIPLVTEALVAVSHRPEAPAYGMALDPAPLVALHAELASAEAALAASKAEFERVQTLNRGAANVSRKALDSAEAQYRADESRVRLAQRQIAAGWGAAMSDLSTAQREVVVQRLVTREIVLVRVGLPAGEILRTAPAAARAVALGHEDRPVTTRLVFDASAIDERTRGQGFLLQLDTQGLPLRPGAAVTVYLEIAEAPEEGVVIPRAAVVRLGGAAWAYVQVGEDGFTRRTVVLDRPTAEGWFSVSGFGIGDRIVVAGAQILLSEELKSEIQIGEEAEAP